MTAEDLVAVGLRDEAEAKCNVQFLVAAGFDGTVAFRVRAVVHRLVFLGCPNAFEAGEPDLAV